MQKGKEACEWIYGYGKNTCRSLWVTLLHTKDHPSRRSTQQIDRPTEPVDVRQPPSWATHPSTVGL